MPKSPTVRSFSFHIPLSVFLFTLLMRHVAPFIHHHELLKVSCTQWTINYYLTSMLVYFWNNVGEVGSIRHCWLIRFSVYIYLLFFLQNTIVYFYCLYLTYKWNDLHPCKWHVLSINWHRWSFGCWFSTNRKAYSVHPMSNDSKIEGTWHNFITTN